jgi:hypothetical protein
MINIIGNIILSATSAAASVVSRVVLDGLKMWLPFERSEIVSSTQVTPDTSGNSNNATLYSGKALSFDGVNDYVDVSGFSMSGSVSTFAFWINSNDTLGRVIDINPNRFIISFNNNQLSLYDGNWKNFGTINTNVWNRCVILTSGTSAKCYVNGVQLGEEKTITAISISSATDAIIGANIAHNQSFFNGEITDLQIYNTAWTEADITYDYNKPNHLVTDNPSTSIALSNLKGYFPLSVGGGLIAFDNSGEGNDGTINGATYVTGKDSIPQLGMIDWSQASNLMRNSEPTAAEGGNSNVTYSSFNFTNTSGPSLDTAIFYGNNSVQRYHYGGAVVGGSKYVISCYVKMDDNSQPVVGTSNTTGDFAFVVAGTPTDSTTPIVTSVGGDVYRVSRAFTAGTKTLTNNGVVKYTGSSSKSFKISGLQLELSESIGNYIKTSGGAITDGTLVQNPNNKGKDIFDNSLRLREHSFNLDGTGYAEVADDNSLDFGTGAFTIEAWVKPKYVAQGASPSTLNAIFTLGGTITTTSSGGLATNSSDKLGAWINGSNIVADSSFVEGIWYYVAVRRNSSGAVRLFINGVEQTSQLQQGASITNANPKFIGKDTSSNRFYHDLIDDVRVYNKALSNDEIEQNYNAGIDAHIVGSSFSDDFSSDYGN